MIWKQLRMLAMRPISGAVAMTVYELFFRNFQFLSLADHGTFDVVCLTDG